MSASLQAAIVDFDSNNPFARSSTCFTQLCQRLQVDALGMTHSDVERLLQSEGRDLLRQMFQDHLDLRGVHEQVCRLGAVTGDDGIVRPLRRDTSCRLTTLLGEVRVPRISYGQRGVQSLFPRDAALNLAPDSFSFGTRHLVALTGLASAFDQTVEQVRSQTGAPVAKRQAEELTVAAAKDFDTFYGQRTPPDAAHTAGLLVLSCDGKGVVVRTADLREATRKAASKRQHKLKTRLVKGEKKYAKRMATVATTYTVDAWPRTAEEVIAELTRTGPEDRPKRPRPEHKRVWASLTKGPEEVIAEMFDEALRRDPDRAKRWIVLVDGNEKQLELIQEQARQRGLSVTIVLDFIHVLQYLWKAAAAFHSEGTPELEQWVLERLQWVLEGKAIDVAAGMRRSATRRELSAMERKPVDKCADYLLKYKACLHYDEYLRDGLPIASGVIEGACRHLVRDRLDLGGARWSLTTAEAVLQWRALKSSGDFEAYWKYHEQQEYQRNHASKYQGAVPSVGTSSQRPRLRLVP
jgi:hypothetical protein